jgi:hypothetical protein
VADEETYPVPSEWYCDRCGGSITDPNKSLVVWRMDEEYRDLDYLIVHKGKCDPRARGLGGHTMSADISAYLGGMASPTS